MAEETSSNAPLESDKSAQPQAAAVKPKKGKPPALEEKPFADFIQQDFFAALASALTKQGLATVELTLANQTIPIRGLNQAPGCWQVIGSWEQGRRQFNLYFLEGDIQKQKAFSCTANDSPTSTLEPFLGDERKITLDLLIFGVIQRLNGQKWLAQKKVQVFRNTSLSRGCTELVSECLSHISTGG
jgi:hypothetical protein